MTLSETLEHLDPGHMYTAIKAFPDHLQEGWIRGAAADAFGYVVDQFDGVVVCGMGGSAIGGDLVRTLIEPECPIPFQSVRNYDLPGWIGEKTLVIVSSYSGGTEETLSAFAQALERGATVVVVTSGGEARARAEKAGLKWIEIPGGLQPRAAVGYSFGVVLRIARAFGMTSVPAEDMAEALKAVRVRTARYAHMGPNPSFDMAEALHEMLPVIYSGVGLLEVVNLRWRTQIHENAKTPAVGHLFPELDHNEIMSFEAAPREIAGRMAVVVLRDRDDHPQVQRRMDITREIVQPYVGAWYEVETEGESRLARMCSLIQLGDWTSFWLAMRQRVDPSPVGSIEQLKGMLAEE